MIIPTPRELETMHAEEVILPTTDGEAIVILDEECTRAEHVLEPSRALAFAERLIALARQAEPPRTLRRPAEVDDHLRELDD